MTKNKNKEHWAKSAWAISIGTAIFSLLLTMIYDYSKERPILTTVWETLKWIINVIWTILDFDLKVWWVVGFVIISILILIVISKLNRGEISKPDFYSYRQDKLKRWTWTWNWHWDDTRNSWIISDLKAHCPKCNTPMIEHSSIYSLSFNCPRCEFYARDGECDETYKIERIILDNVNRKRAEKGEA